MPTTCTELLYDGFVSDIKAIELLDEIEERFYLRKRSLLKVTLQERLIMLVLMQLKSINTMVGMEKDMQSLNRILEQRIMYM